MEKMPNQTEALVDSVKESTYREVLVKYQEILLSNEFDPKLQVFLDWLKTQANV